MNEEYAIQIARDWNMPACSSGFVTKSVVKKEYPEKYQVQNIGGPIHNELRVPAEELDEFNRKVVGLIAVTQRF